LAVGVLVGLGGANSAWAQRPAQPAPAAQPAAPAIPAELASPSKVFPDGGFPSTPHAPEGGIPPAAPMPGPGAAYPPPKPPTADYAPPRLRATGHPATAGCGGVLPPVHGAAAGLLLPARLLREAHRQPANGGRVRPAGIRSARSAVGPWH